MTDVIVLLAMTMALPIVPIRAGKAWRLLLAKPAETRVSQWV